MTAACESFIDWWEANGFCGEPAIGMCYAACEHEHINERPICAACAVELQRDGDGWECSWCDHRCRFLFGIRFDSGEDLVLSDGGLRPTEPTQPPEPTPQPST